jgi:hypothetical protein
MTQANLEMLNALQEAGVGAVLASNAATVIASLQNDVALLKWMTSINTAGIVFLVVRAFV